MGRGEHWGKEHREEGSTGERGSTDGREGSIGGREHWEAERSKTTRFKSERCVLLDQDHVLSQNAGFYSTKTTF